MRTEICILLNFDNKHLHFCGIAIRICRNFALIQEKMNFIFIKRKASVFVKKRKLFASVEDSLKTRTVFFDLGFRKEGHERRLGGLPSSFAVFQRACAKGGFENLGKIVVIGNARVLCDLLDRHVRGAEQACGVF